MKYEFNTANVCSNPLIIWIKDFRFVELAELDDGRWIFGGWFTSDDLSHIEVYPCSMMNGTFAFKSAALSYIYHLIKDMEIKNQASYRIMLDYLSIETSSAYESLQLSLF